MKPGFWSSLVLAGKCFICFHDSVTIMQEIPSSFVVVDANTVPFFRFHRNLSACPVVSTKCRAEIEPHSFQVVFVHSLQLSQSIQHREVVSASLLVGKDLLP